MLVRLGVRNVGRRRAWTALIVLGLMLGTTIVAASLATGDTMSHTIRSSAIEALGEADEVVSAEGDEGPRPPSSAPRPAGRTSPRRWPDACGPPRRHRAGDGVAPAIVEAVAAQAPRSGAEPRVTLFGADPAAMSGFGEIRAVSGGTVTLSALGPGEGT